MSCSGFKRFVLLCLALQAASSVDGGIDSITNHGNTSIVPTATRTVTAKSACPKTVTKTRTIARTTIRPKPSTTTITSRTTKTIRPKPSTTTVTSRTTTTVIPAPSTTTLTSTITPTPVTTTVTTTIQPSCSTTPEPMSSTTPSTTPSGSTTPGPNSGTNGSFVPIECAGVATVVDTWDDGYSVDLRIPFSENIEFWILEIQFSGCIFCFKFLKGEPYLFQIVPKFYHPSTLAIFDKLPQSAGDVVTISGKIIRGNGNMPSITKIDLLTIGKVQNICATSSMTKRDFNVTRTIQNQRSTGCCSCVVDDQCNCKYLPARPMTCIGLLGRLESIYTLTLPFFGPVNSWIATVTFSTPIESLSDQGASKLPGTPAHDITQGPTEFKISNNTVDAVQCAGSVATLFLEIKGVTSATVISAITVNGQTVCTGDIPIG